MLLHKQDFGPLMSERLNRFKVFSAWYASDVVLSEVKEKNRD